MSEPFANIELYNLMCGELTNASLNLSLTQKCHAGLLCISPSPNNGTVGSLYHLLTPSLLSSLSSPPSHLHKHSMFKRPKELERVVPTQWIKKYTTQGVSVRSACAGTNVATQNVSNATISEANQLLNLTADNSKLTQWRS